MEIKDEQHKYQNVNHSKSDSNLIDQTTIIFAGAIT